MSCSASVAHTATYAINAKISALSVGYKPVKPLDDLYAKVLGRVNSALCKKQWAFKRQAPLVNAGYAARMAAVSHTVGRFVLAHHGDLLQRNVEDRKAINIVLVGCGMEALGIWASALSSCPSIVCIYEVDCEESCSAKSRALVQSGLVTAASRKIGGDSSVYLMGETNVHTLASKEEKNVPDVLPAGGSHYALMSADLKDMDSVRRAMNEAKFVNTHPTIVISELVLAYLGRAYADKLLRYIATEVCVCEESLFFAYEPIGVEPSRPECPTVVGDYVEEFCEKFRGKLNRGRHDKAIITSDGDCCDVLGDGCKDTLSRFSICGFEGPIGCCIAGIAASAACGGSMVAKETFDEHLELVMHLHCYGTVCAFSYETRQSFASWVCPWLKLPSASTCNCRSSDVWENVELQDGYMIKISPIKSEDQERVRDLILATYQELFDDYPSVRKLVKSALKNDLSGKHSDVSSIKGASAINERYCNDGGGFWVATLSDNSSRRVIGCIGIRPYVSKRYVDERVYEIQRLAVDGEYRGRGIGKALLEFMEGVVLRTNKDSGGCMIIAITPLILSSANHFYNANGYDRIEEKLVGKMKMNTYVKPIRATP